MTRKHLPSHNQEPAEGTETQFRYQRAVFRYRFSQPRTRRGY